MEVDNKRVVIPMSLYLKAKEIAESRGEDLNEFIAQCLEKGLTDKVKVQNYFQAL